MTTLLIRDEHLTWSDFLDRVWPNIGEDGVLRGVEVVNCSIEDCPPPQPGLRPLVTQEMLFGLELEGCIIMYCVFRSRGREKE